MALLFIIFCPWVAWVGFLDRRRGAGRGEWWASAAPRASAGWAGETGAGLAAAVGVDRSPASGVTAAAGTGGALGHSLGQPIRILRGGTLVPARGWRESRPFLMPPPIGRARGYLMESVHAA